ncbi:MAG TPA: hypothetical protein VLA12_15120, partial [Planctomycetaceae bacterium]|nr:hypothetical protein [Planctomycetaceae bacterium]
MQNDSFNLPAPPGFRGMHPDLPVRIYRRHLPHWRQEGATYFLTFRLADSIPQTHKHMKGYVARQANQILGRSGRLWAQESYDRIIRDAEHLYRVVQY